MRAKELAPWPALVLLFFGAFSVTGIAEEQRSKLPTFTWLDNLNIIVLFPNGVEDTIELCEVEKFGNLAVPCLYEGILKADNSSTVALSGCQHDEVINLVMYTKYLPQNTMFNIINGTVEEVEKIYFSKNNAKVTKRKRRRLTKRGAYLDDGDYDEVAFDSGSEPEPPAFLSLEVKLAFEETLLTEKVTEVAAREYIARVFTLGKQHLRHPTLGSVINLKAQGPIRRIIGKSWVPTTSNLTESKDYKEPENRPITFFCYNQDRDNDTGISYIRKACDEKKGVAIVAARKDINKAAQTYAHECGHWLGLPHDAEEDEDRGTSCEGSGLMSRPGGRPEQWSHCNKRRFRRWYNRNSNKFSHCLKDEIKDIQMETSCLGASYKTVVAPDVKCKSIKVTGADYANCNGIYILSPDRVPWMPSKPVYGNVTLDRYIYWNARGHGWSIGSKNDMRTCGYLHYSGLDSFEPWEAPWTDGIIVKCQLHEGAVIHEEDSDGDWDVDHSFGGLTLQIKYKDPANMWKGGHAHFEVEDLKALIPAARSRNVTLDIIFDGGATKMDGIFNLKIEYSLQHTFEEKGIFEFDRKHVGNYWISAIFNKKIGGGNGKRIFPEMEFHEINDRSTMYTATYNSDRLKSVKVVIKRDPGKQLDGTLEGNFLGKHVKITLHGTRNSATNKLDGTLTVEIGPKKFDFKITVSRNIGAERELDIKLTGNVEGQTMEIVFAGKRTEWIKFEGSLKFTYGQKNYQFSWVVDRTNGVKVLIKANTGKGDNVIKYRRNANWKIIKFSLNLFGTEMVAVQIRRDIKSVWDRKTVIVYKGVLFEKQGYQGKMTLQVQEVDAHTKRFSVIEDTRNKKEVLKYVNTITHKGINPSQFELDANSMSTVSPNSILHVFACNPVFSAFNFLCFNHRTMETKFRADKTKPYKMIVHTKVDKDGAEEFRIDMQTQTSPYTLTFNWPRMRAIVAPYRNRPLEITANHNPGTSLAITSNIRGFEQFSVVKMPNGHRKVTLNNKEVVTVGLWKSGRTITQSTTLPDGRALTTTFKWGNDNNWLNNHIELDLDVTERKLDSKFEWNFLAALGTWKLDAVGHNNRWGDYHIHRTGKYANNGGVWFFDVDGTALWKGNNVKTDIFIKLDTHKVGNGKLDAITAKLIKVVDGKKYEINVTDGKMAPGDFVKVGAFIRDMAH